MNASPRMRVLIAIPSTNQMYSGVGRAIRELCARMANRVAFEFAIDDLNPRNLDLLHGFCHAHQMPIHVGRHACDPRSVDPSNLDLPSILAHHTFDAIELIGFANAATGRTVLDSLGDRTLVYTPHDQPLWTVPMSPDQCDHVAAVHRTVIERADLVLADSPHERHVLQSYSARRSHVEFHPLGCDFEAFRPGPIQRPERLLFIGDFNEVRKRFDRVAAVVERLLPTHPDLVLTVVGNKSEAMGATLSPALRRAVELRGTISDPELRSLYQESRGLLLFSEVEAFGLPILEALATATPVYLTDLATTRSLFGAFPSAVFCNPSDLDATAARVARGLDQSSTAIAVAVADRPAVKSRFDWNLLAEQKAAALAAAWWRRNRWQLSA